MVRNKSFSHRLPLRTKREKSAEVSNPKWESMKNVTDGSKKNEDYQNSLKRLSSEVAENINRYNMFSKDSVIPIAFSGGKDSTATILLLKYLGYSIIPVIVDRDDPLFDSSKISLDLKKFWGIKSVIIHLRDENYLTRICPFAASEIREYMRIFDSLGENGSHCTPCYNARTVALSEFALRTRTYVYVLGQHKTDMVTSLMKSYWSEIYWKKYTSTRGIPYDGRRMKELIETSKIDLDYLKEMVKKGRASTDDPPMEYINESVRLVRPLFSVAEKDIEALIRYTKYPATSTNCSYREEEPDPSDSSFN